MPFMALMAAPLSEMLSVTEDDGSLDYPSHARARTADNLFWRQHVSPLSALDVVDDPGDGMRSLPGRL